MIHLLTIYINVLQSYDLIFYGITEEKVMYHYVDDKEFLGRMRRLCSDIVNQLVQKINREEKLQVRADLVGSGAKNLITQNANNPIDLDYNLEILKSYEYDIYDGRSLKKYIGEKFNEVLQEHDWSNCDFSSSVFTTEQRYFVEGNQTRFSIDICVVTRMNGRWQRLICEKTGFISEDKFYWNVAPCSKKLMKKVEWIKKNGKWQELRVVYLRKKNQYLTKNNYDHSSFNVYIESVHEIYYKYCH